MTSARRFVAHSDARRRALESAKQAASAGCAVLSVGPTGAGAEAPAAARSDETRVSA